VGPPLARADGRHRFRHRVGHRRRAFYQAELDTLLGGPRFETTDGQQTPAAIEQAVLAANPGAEITAVEWPSDGPNVVRVGLVDDGRARNVWVDNGSGRLVQPRQQMLVLLGIRRLHVNLFMGRFGRMIVTWTSAAALIALVLGIYLWWPGIRKFWSGFQIRLRRGFYILNFDLHQALGILAMPLLIFGSATGVFIVYGGVVDGIEQVVHGTPPPPTGWGDLRSSEPDGGPVPGVPLATVVAAAGAQAPEATLRLVTMPAAADGLVEAELAVPGGATVRVALDRYTGEVLETRRETPDFRYDRHTNEQLHIANIGGPVFAALYMLSCAIGFILVPTGVVVWWMKRTRKAESADRRAEGRVVREAGAAG
jgi:uncharacterized iron-regulated membrane protein